MLCSFLRNSLGSKSDAVKVVRKELNSGRGDDIAMSALLASGFKQISTNDTDYETLLPCPLGTFSDPSGKHKCTECPPGISVHVYTVWLTGTDS